MSSEVSKPLSGLVLLVYSKVFYFFVILYLYFSVQHGALFPWNWGNRDSFVFSSLFFTFLVTIAIYYIDITPKLKGDQLIQELYDFDAYRGEKLLDAILAHYTNVATVGVFIIAIIYTMEKHFITEHNEFWSLFSSFLYVLVILLYCLFVFRLLNYLKEKYLEEKYAFLRYLTVSFFVIIIDIKLIEVFIGTSITMSPVDILITT